ncbi:hypothetical protein BDV06DRAFT_233584 [Aspergillus oleicola]
MEELNGRWLMEKSLSTGTDAMLKLQGIGWTLRKGISLATIRLEITVHPGTTSPSPSTIDVLATLTGGIAGNKETKILNWEPTDQNDYLMGLCEARSELVHGVPDEQGDIYPEFEMVSVVPDERARRYLRGEILDNGARATWALANWKNEGKEGGEEGRGTWVHTVLRNKDVGWTVEQIWAVEVIEGKKYHTRRIVAANKGQYVLGKIMYSYIGEVSGAKQ